MISKNEMNRVRSLHQKKFRQMYGIFLVEGVKMVNELLSSSLKVHSIYATAGCDISSQVSSVPLIIVSESDLKKLSTQENPDGCIAVAEIPASDFDAAKPLAGELYLLCDGINDPGNAGTIIRTAEWFGISHVFFSENSVEAFNPKTVAASKGSIFRVSCVYTDLQNLIAANTHLPVYGAFMNGENIYTTPLQNKGMIVIGNEANGISVDIAERIQHKVCIPNFGKAESLNAGVATGIILSEFKRRM